MKSDFSTAVPGHLKAVDYATKEIKDLGGKPVGNLDGLEPDGEGGYLATDWVGGALYALTSEGRAELLKDLDQGSADLEYIPSENEAVIPMMMDGTVTAYKLQ